MVMTNYMYRHGLGHLIEVFTAISEGAYITATLAGIFITMEIVENGYIYFDIS